MTARLFDAATRVRVGDTVREVNKGSSVGTDFCIVLASLK